MNDKYAVKHDKQTKLSLESSFGNSASWFQKWKDRNQRKRWIKILNKTTSPKDFVNKLKELEANTFGNYLTMYNNGSFSVAPEWITRSTDLTVLQYAILCERADVLKYLDTPEGKYHSMNNAQRSFESLKQLSSTRKAKKLKR